MASDTFQGIVIGVVAVALFTFVLIGFIVGAGTDYGMDSSDLTGSALNYSGLDNALSGAQSEAENWKDTFEEGNILEVSGLVVTGFFRLAKTMFAVIISPFVLFMQILTDVLGIPAIVSSILFFIFITMILFAIWRLIKAGDWYYYKMPYPNITDRNLSKGFEELFYYTNEVTDSWISNLILIAVYIIIAIGVYNYERDMFEGLAIAGIITGLIGGLFWVAGFVSSITLIFVVAVAMVSFGLLWFSKKNPV